MRWLAAGGLVVVLTLMAAVPTLAATTQEITITAQGAGGNYTAPVVVTDSGNYTSCTEATLYGNVTDTGNSTIDQRGVVYGLACQNDPGNATAPADSAWDDYELGLGSWGMGSYSTDISSLNGNTTYWWAAVVRNSAGYWDYGKCSSFTTSECPEPTPTPTPTPAQGAPTWAVGDCVGPDGLTVDETDTDEITLTWSGGNATDFIVQGSCCLCSQSPNDGMTVYSGNLTTVTFWANLDDTMCFVVWGDCGNYTYSANSAHATIGGAGVTAIGIGLFSLGLILLALGLTVAMFVTRNKMLGFPCLIFWAILGGYFYQQSEATWDINYLLFFASFGMAIFTGYAAYTLRKSDLSGPDADKGAFIDESGSGSRGSGGFMDKGDSDGFGDEDDTPSSRPSLRTKELRARATRRRSGESAKKSSWGEFK